MVIYTTLLSSVLAFGQTPAVWRTDPSMDKQLGAPVAVGPYKMRPPRGYQAQVQPGPSGSKGYAWVGAQRANGTRPMLMVVIAPFPKGESASLETVAQKFLKSARLGKSNFRASVPQSGKIGALPFLRTGWTGVVPQADLAMRGFQYVTIDRGVIVELWSQDIAPAGYPSLKLAEASLLTFGK